ncbi:MAG: hypothetical protein WBC13_13975 [Dokdonella sp.]
MTNPFLTSSTHALRALDRAQVRHARLKAKADRRLEVAQARHAAELDRAAAVEAAAWHALLAVPGMTITTAAVLTSTSESTVNRWTSRARQRPEAASVS